MGSFLSNMFINPETLSDDGYGFIQVCFLFCCYGAVLFEGAEQISSGSELLQLVPSMKGIVGSVVLPVLGAVPDGAIVLFSGLGSDAQEQLSVGVGALAGSTVMLLTIPWMISVFFGRVKILPDGMCCYKKPAGRPDHDFSLCMGVEPACNALFNTGVALGGTVRINAKIMFLTSLGYFFIQVPGFMGHCGTKSDIDKSKCDVDSENKWALFGMLYCILAFCAYLAYQMVFNNNLTADRAIEKALRNNETSFFQCVKTGLVPLDQKRDGDNSCTRQCATRFSWLAGDERQSLTANHEADKMAKKILQRFFRRYDNNDSNSIDRTELTFLLGDMLGPEADSKMVDDWLNIADVDHDGCISFSEFVDVVPQLMKVADSHQDKRDSLEAMAQKAVQGLKFGEHMDDKTYQSQAKDELGASTSDAANAGNEDDEEEEDEEIPEDLAELDFTSQQKALKQRALQRCLWGTLLVLLFSDPMVDILSDIGRRLSIKSFYVSFVLAPLASNASELVAAINFSKKKTRDSITTAMDQCLGAACMNNTFCLGIFLGLIYFKSLTWEFSAETISIIFCELCIGIIAMKRVQTVFMGFVVLMFYFGCVGTVAVLENLTGLN